MASPRLSSEAPAFSVSRFTGFPAAIVIAALAFLLGLSASIHNAPTFDEGAHLAGGYIHWTLGQPRIHTENGYLSQALATLPLLLTHPRLPDTASRAFLDANPFILGRDFLFDRGNDPTTILLFGRAVIGLLTMLTTLVVYTWSRRLFGPLGGILSLVVFALSPLVLAHGFLATSDMAATCFFTLSLGASWQLLDRITIPRLFVSACALTALFLSKDSAPLILPVLLLLLIIRILDRKPILFSPRLKLTAAASRFRKSAVVAGLLVFHALAVWILIWAAYGFTYSAFKDSPPGSGQTLRPADGWNWVLQKPDVLLNSVAFARDHHLLPEAYLYGYAYVVQTTRLAVCFADGTVTHGSWWWFYPYVELITTPLAIFALAILAGLAAHSRFKSSPLAPGKRIQSAVHAAAPLLAFILFYWLAAIFSYRGTGPRHLLPVYPACCILLGAIAWLPFSRKIFPAATALLFLWLAAESFWIRPHYLSYFNELVGGPSNGYHYLVDSAIDWGQDLPALSAYLKDHNPESHPVYFAYFGTADPAFYKIQAAPLPSFLPQPAEEPAALPVPLQPGIYCISVTLLQNLYGDYAGNYTPTLEKSYVSTRYFLSRRDQFLADPRTSPENRALLLRLPTLVKSIRFARLCAYLRHHQPAAQAGYSINIYNVTANDLREALDGPPFLDP